MAVEFTSTDEPLTDYGVKMAVYSPAGAGKTMLIATMPGDILMLGVERGHLSLSRANQLRVFGTYKKVDIMQIQSAGDLAVAYGLAVKSPHRSIALDSSSEIAERILTEQMFLNKDPRKAYGEMQQIMSKYLRLFRDIPGKHVLFTSQMEKVQDANGLIQYGPSMPGKTLTQDFPYYFDEVFSLFISPKDKDGKDWRVIRTRPDNQFSAKDRSGALAELEPPNLTDIINKIRQP